MSTMALTPVALTPVALTPDALTPDALAPVAADRAPRLRLTRRGRAVLGVLLAAPIAVVLAISALGSGPAQAGSTVSTTEFSHITVAQGESLWDLAAWIAPDADPREVVADLVSLNQLATTEVHAGQRLAIPLAYAE